MSKVWRIKTEKEFKRENLWNTEYNVPIGWNRVKKMNYLMGKTIPTDQLESCSKSLALKIDGWKIKNSDYVFGTSELTDDFVVTPVVVDEVPKIFFNIDRLSKEIDNLFKQKFDDSFKRHEDLHEKITSALELRYKAYLKKVKKILPDIKEELLDEIRRGHTTLVLPNVGEVSIQESDHPKFKDVITSLHTYKKSMLVGPAGTGKTYMVAEIAKRLNVPFYKYSCSRDSSVHDLIGYKQPTSETYLETTFLKAYENGGMFLVDKLFVQIY